MREASLLGEKPRRVEVSLDQKADLSSEVEQLNKTHKDNNRLIHPKFSYTVSQVIAAVRYEMACTLADVMARRTRMLFLDVRSAREILRPCSPDNGARNGKERRLDRAAAAGFLSII